MARCVEFVLRERSGSTLAKVVALQRKQGVEGVYALVWGGSSTAHLLEPFRTIVV